MGADTKIEWADHTMNFWVGCEKVGPGCLNCYAETWAGRAGIPQIWGPGAERRRTQPGNWLQPEKWNARHQGLAPGLVFTNSLADFWDKAVPEAWRVEAVEVMRRTPNLIWLILTKRVPNILKLMPRGGLPRNVALGFSAVTQEELDRDGPRLLDIAGELDIPTTFLSSEPQVGRMDPTRVLELGLSWLIAGGESGPGARATDPDWFRLHRDACARAGVPFLFKQWGEWAPCPKTMVDGVLRERTFQEALRFAKDRSTVALSSGVTMIRVGKQKAGRKLDGQEHSGFPAIFRRVERIAA